MSQHRCHVSAQVPRTHMKGFEGDSKNRTNGELTYHKDFDEQTRSGREDPGGRVVGRLVSGVRFEI